MKTLTQFCRETYGEKLYKLSLSVSRTCPNRDGTLDTRGCIFCAGGSGDFAECADLPVSEQIDRAKVRVADKFSGGRYIAYFQSYTSTYGDVRELEPRFMEAAERDDIAVVSMATRPDCLGPEVMAMLTRLSAVKPLWVELGMQTSKPETAKYIRRGYELEVYDRAVRELNAMGVHTVTHIILGLPRESRDDMRASLHHALSAGTAGVKLQLLHVLRGTDLARDYENSLFETLTLDEYADIVSDLILELPENTVLHRYTGDGNKRILIAPQWSGDKKRVLNTINAALRSKGIII